jgi:hypothetical protein
MDFLKNWEHFFISIYLCGAAPLVFNVEKCRFSIPKFGISVRSEQVYVNRFFSGTAGPMRSFVRLFALRTLSSNPKREQILKPTLRASLIRMK